LQEALKREIEALVAGGPAAAAAAAAAASASTTATAMTATNNGDEDEFIGSEDIGITTTPRTEESVPQDSLLCATEASTEASTDVSSSSSSTPIDRRRVLVVACHACQFLTDDVLAIAEECQVQVAVMPCCQKDGTRGSLKSFSRAAGLEFGLVHDIMTAVNTSRMSISTSNCNRYLLLRLRFPFSLLFVLCVLSLFSLARLSSLIFPYR
jgi:hypothetical protein